MDKIKKSIEKILDTPKGERVASPNIGVLLGDVDLTEYVPPLPSFDASVVYDEDPSVETWARCCELDMMLRVHIQVTFEEWWMVERKDEGYQHVIKKVRDKAMRIKERLGVESSLYLQMTWGMQSIDVVRDWERESWNNAAMWEPPAGFKRGPIKMITEADCNRCKSKVTCGSFEDMIKDCN